jgi:hypothetical protein
METNTAAVNLDSSGLLSRMPSRWVLLTFLCLALVVRGRTMLSNLDSLQKDPDAYRDVAWNIYFEHTLGLWNDATGAVEPTATRPPLYPLLLSAMYFLRFTPDAPGIGLLQVLLGAGTVWLVWRLGLAWGLSPATSLLAALLVMVDPILLNQSVLAMTETLATLLTAIALSALTRAGQDNRLRCSAVAGAALALCVLCRPAFLVWLLAAVALFPWVAVGARRFARAAAMIVGATMVLSPWAIRNMTVFELPIITTTHGGYTLLLANNPEFYDYLRSAPWGSVWDAREFNEQWRADVQSQNLSTSPDAAARELESDRQAYATAWQNIRREPAMFAYSCLARLARLWNVMPHQTTPDESPSRRGLRVAIAIWYLLELLLAAAGIALLRRRLLLSPWLWGTILVLSLSAVQTVFWTDMRMRAPLVIVVALLASQAVAMLATGRSASSAAKPTT